MAPMKWWLPLVLGVGLTGCTDKSDPKLQTTTAAAGPATEGRPAPTFEAPSTEGTFSLAAQKGKPVVVYFYPKDETHGCTIEAEGIRDEWQKLRAAQVTVVGISADSIESHRAFAAAHGLPFPLVTDPDGAIGRQYGVPFTKVHARQTFLIAPDGTIQKIWRDVTPTGHAGEILAAVKS
jgi:thioredoxin-dependent peroxiredoxin